jgi:hypothetical protein
MAALFWLCIVTLEGKKWRERRKEEKHTVARVASCCGDQIVAAAFCRRTLPLEKKQTDRQEERQRMHQTCRIIKIIMMRTCITAPSRSKHGFRKACDVFLVTVPNNSQQTTVRG